MAKLQALEAIEALTPQRLAEALINNGYPQCRQLIIDKGINGAAFMNLTELRLKQYQIYLKPTDIHRLWSLIVRTKEHPEDFVLPNMDTRPTRREFPSKPVRPQKNRTSITQALRDRVAHQAVCVQESSDEDTPDHMESEWSDEEKMPPETHVNDEKKEKTHEMQQVNMEDKKLSFKENRERIMKLFQGRQGPEVESEQTKRAPPPPIPSKNKEPVYVNIQEMKEEAEKNVVPTPSKLDVPPKPPRPSKPDKKPAITDVAPPKMTLQSETILPEQDTRRTKPDVMPLKAMTLKPDIMPLKAMPPKPGVMQSNADKMPSKAELFSKADKMFSKLKELSPEQDKIPPKHDQLPAKPIRAGNAPSKFSQENKIGPLRIPPGLNKFLLAASQTNNNKTAEPELPPPRKPLQKQSSYDDVPVNVYDEIPDIDTPPSSPPPNFPLQKPENISKLPPPPPPSISDGLPSPPPLFRLPLSPKQESSMLRSPSPTTLHLPQKDDSAAIRRSPSPKPEAVGFRLPPLPKQDEPSGMRLPPPSETLRPAPMPPTPQRKLMKAEDEDNYEPPPAIRLNGNGNFGPPLPRRPHIVVNNNDDEDEDGYLINTDLKSSKESLCSNQVRPLPPVPSEEGGAAAASPLERNMYYRDVERKAAENLLAFQPVGSFLLRRSKTYFATLVIKSRQRVCNVPIVRDGSQYYLLMDTNFLDQALMFSSLENLITHYTTQKVPLKDNSLCLRRNNNLPR